MRALTLMSALAAATAVLAAAPVAAHPRLVSSTPAEASTVAKPRAIVLTFSEKLMAAASGFELAMTGMPGMSDHAPMKITGFTASVGPDGKSLRATLPRPLPAGTYEVNWFAVAADTHRIKGKISFSVR